MVSVFYGDAEYENNVCNLRKAAVHDTDKISLLKVPRILCSNLDHILSETVFAIKNRQWLLH